MGLELSTYGVTAQKVARDDVNRLREDGEKRNSAAALRQLNSNDRLAQSDGYSPMTLDKDREVLRLPEDEAHRVLARAVELDARLASEMPITRLREIAIEAGISPDAFEAALNEATAIQRRASTDQRKAPLLGRFARIFRGPEPRIGDEGVGSSILDNVVSIAAFWGIFVLLHRILRGLDVNWVLLKAANPIALMLGTAIGHRLHARLATFVLGGLAVAAGAEVIMDTVFGTPAVRGGPAHFALIVAGVAGVAVGALVNAARRKGSKAPAAPQASSTVTSDAAPANARSDDRALSLRLHPIPGWR